MTDPVPGETITIQGKTFKFQQASGNLGGVKFEVGKAARVYKLWSDKKPFAIKAFFPQYRSQRNLNATEQISLLKDIPGLLAASRYCITQEQQPELVKRHDAFQYGVLMPWVEGLSWSNIVGNGNSLFSPVQSLSLSRALVSAFAELEENRLAHCDISNGNFLILNNFQTVELVDIEELYSEKFSCPNPKPVGTDGYAPEWIVNDGYWGADGDRFAAVILCIEALCWQFSDIRENAESQTLFASGEFGFNSKRYKLVKKHLSELSIPNLNSEKVVQIFETTWHSKSLEECPKIKELKDALVGVNQQRVKHQSDPLLQLESPLGRNLIKGAPTSMQSPGYTSPYRTITDARISDEPPYIDFGIINASEADLPKVTIKVMVSNPGKGLVTGTINPSDWLEIFPSREFSIRPDTPMIEFTVKMKTNFPHPMTGQTHMFPNGIIIKTNVGQKVIGGQYSLPKPKKWGLF